MNKFSESPSQIGSAFAMNAEFGEVMIPLVALGFLDLVRKNHDGQGKD